MKKLKLLAIMIPLIISLIALTSCSSKEQSSTSNANNEKQSESLITLDSAKTIEKAVQASRGGYLGIKGSDGVKIRALFGREALRKDATLVMAPIAKAPVKDDRLLAKGFSLEEKETGKGPELRFPVMIVFAIKGSLPKTASIIKYHDNDKEYDVIPTTRSDKNGTTILAASVSSFSAYGVGNLEPQEQQNAAQKNASGKTWVITVNDNYSFNNGPMKTKVTLNLKATSQSGTIYGAYKGTASANVQQDMSGARGSITAPTVATDNNLSFTVDGPLVALTEPEEPLASLVPPGDGPDWSAYGNLNMKAGGQGTVSARGYSVSAPVRPKDAPTPFELTVIGSHVRIMVKHPVGTFWFDGSIAEAGS